jgi:GNAT superfamily N-acetyltransferase
MKENQVSRAPVVVRSAVPEDARSLIELWTADASQSGGAEAPDPALEDGPRAQEAAACIAQIAADPDHQLLVAEIDGTILGAMHLRRGRVSPIQLAEAVHVTHLQVRGGYRRRGIATALLSAATAWADEKDSPHLLAVAPAQSREAQRFLARLGFAQVAVVRAVATSTLRHRFSTMTVSRETNRLLAARRTLRRRREQLATH